MVIETSAQDCDGDKYKRELDLGMENNSLSLMFNHITENSVVLDVGCACGDLGVALKNIKYAEVYGLDYNQDSVEMAKKTGAYKEVLRVDLDQINGESFPQYRSKFDFIVCGDILEHLRNPKFVLNVLKLCLKQGGSIIASIPNIAHMSIKANLLLNNFDYTPTGLLDKTHIHFFTYKSIAELLSSAGLTVDACDFTMFDKIGTQQNDPYPFLPNEIQKFLFKDYHSYVLQYVIKMSISSNDNTALLEHNLSQVNLNEWTAPLYILNYRNQILRELFLSDL